MREQGRFSRMAEAGIEKIKSFAQRTGRKAKDLGSQGVLKVEISQLNYQIERLIAKLGEEVYRSLVTLDHATVSRETAAIRAILEEIAAIKAEIELKEKECEAIGENS